MSQKAVMYHWNKDHNSLDASYHLVDTATGQKLPLHKLYRCLALCPDPQCDKVLGGNNTFDILKHNMKAHFIKSHGEIKADWDFTILLPPPLSPKVETMGGSSVPLNVPPSVPPSPPVKSVAIADGSVESSTSFTNKGYSGPYCCLRLGCSYVCEEFGQSSPQLLVSHWASNHGNVRNLLYLDRATMTVLNVVVVCNNIGYCSAPSCTHLMYDTNLADFKGIVATHWRTKHPERLATHTSLEAQVRLISASMV